MKLYPTGNVLFQSKTFKGLKHPSEIFFLILLKVLSILKSFHKNKYLNLDCVLTSYIG